jgi:5-methylthioribose kinase
MLQVVREVSPCRETLVCTQQELTKLNIDDVEIRQVVSKMLQVVGCEVSRREIAVCTQQELTELEHQDGRRD